MIDQMQIIKHIKTHLPVVCLDQIIQYEDSQIVDWGLVQNKIPETWKITKGEGIKVMVIDTGHPVHSDIGDNVIIGDNFVEDEPHEDLNGHQTHCVGIICAKNNKFGMVGVAPEAQCISVKALNKNGSGNFSSLAKALDYAIKIKPDIISMSLGSPTYSALIHQKIKTLYNLNIPVVCAAGNSGNGGVNYPAAFKETIAVASYNKQGKISFFSSKGEEVDWATPGEKIYSTYLNNKYSVLSGTSMACPFLVGIIALMLSKHRLEESKTGFNDCKTISQIKEHLLKYTQDKGAGGKDDQWGYGVINIKEMILDKNPDDKLPEPPLTPNPEPKPKPEPESRPSFLKKSLAWVIFGCFLLTTLVLYIASTIQDDDNIDIPYIDEQGNIDWDKKFELETR